jgi:autotransporter-associated beta strand protein
MGGEGGNGGAGGDGYGGRDGAHGTSGGNGGRGGIGVSAASDATIENTGNITGGAGGRGGLGGPVVTAVNPPPRRAAPSGAGGAGIEAAGATITNNGTITGGLSGDGATRASAIRFTGGGNTLNLQSGSAIVGAVEIANPSTTATIHVRASGVRLDHGLILGGAATVNTGGNQMDIAGHITGAGSFTKTGAGALGLSGTNTYGGGTTVAEGTLRAGAAHTFSAASVHTVAPGAFARPGRPQPERGVARQQRRRLARRQCTGHHAHRHRPLRRQQRRAEARHRPGRQRQRKRPARAQWPERDRQRAHRRASRQPRRAGCLHLGQRHRSRQCPQRRHHHRADHQGRVLARRRPRGRRRLRIPAARGRCRRRGRELVPALHHHRDRPATGRSGLARYAR